MGALEGLQNFLTSSNASSSVMTICFLYYLILCKKIECACNSMVSNHRLGAFRVPCVIHQLKINDWFFCSGTVGFGNSKAGRRVSSDCTSQTYKWKPYCCNNRSMFRPFDLSSQKETATRNNLDLRLSEDWENRIEDMGSILINLVVGDSEIFYGEARS